MENPGLASLGSTLQQPTQSQNQDEHDAMEEDDAEESDFECEV